MRSVVTISPPFRPQTLASSWKLAAPNGHVAIAAARHLYAWQTAQGLRYSPSPQITSCSEAALATLASAAVIRNFMVPVQRQTLICEYYRTGARSR